MKQLSAIVLGVSLTVGAFAQNEGEIIYLEKMNMHMNLPEEAEQMKAFIPEFIETKFSLKFNETAALYSTVTGENTGAEVNHEEEGMQIEMKIENPEEKTFVNLEKQESVTQREFMGKVFLIEGKVDKSKWKIKDEQKMIKGYPCQKAVLKDSSNTIVAWFTPKIPVATGPRGMGGLPGMILEMDIDDGQATIELASFKPGKLEKDALKPPTKGKKITREEFEVLQAKKMEEMGAQREGGGMFIMRTETDQR
jgi:GLPGLI family protein